MKLLLGVHEGDHDVAGAAGGGQPFMVVSEASWVQQAPAFARGLHLAVVADESAAASLPRKRENKL